MRYYDLNIAPVGAKVPFRRWTSHPNGVFDPGALNVEFDMPLSTYDTPMGMQTITVHGISLQDLTNAQQFVGMQIVMKAGMQAGLPLANPKQAGTILVGQVFQSFGNWEGTEMTLDFVVTASIYGPTSPGNLVLNWTAGMELSTALLNCFAVAYPTYPTVINISSNLVAPEDHKGFYTSLDSLASWLRQYTSDQLLNTVYIAIQGGKIQIFDSLYSPPPTQLAFADMIGQPTWIAPNIMQVKTVMRADMVLGGILKMPQGLQNQPGIVLTSAKSYPSNEKYQSAFQGTFKIIQLRQVGNFRTPDGASWATILNCSVNG